MSSLPSTLPLCPHRYALFVSYLGARYNGSQRLIGRGESSDEKTIQEAIECALENVFPKKRCKLTAGSRIDKGVHALMNCFSLPLMDFSISTEKLKRVTNLQLQQKIQDIM